MTLARTPPAMSLARKLLPWIASALAHGAAFLIPFQLARLPETSAIDQRGATPLSARRVELVFESGSDSAARASTEQAALVSDRPAGEAVLAPSGVLPPKALPIPERGALPLVAPTLRPDAAAVTTGRGAASSAFPAGLPSPEEVLAGLPAASPSSLPAAAASDLPAVDASGALPAADSSLPLERIGWKGAARTVLRRVNPRFPSVLGAIGQEVECEAVITVSPLGTVVDVEITRSSGYTDIDAGVESALRQYIFSRVDGKQNAVGTVSFRFRLEKRD